MPNSDTLSPLDVVVVTEGTMAASTSEYAQQRIAAATASLPARVGSARVRLTRHVDGSPAPVTAQVNLDIGGRLVRAQVAARTEREAVDMLEARLKHVLDRWSRRWSLTGQRPAEQTYPWRHAVVGVIRPRSVHAMAAAKTAKAGERPHGTKDQHRTVVRRKMVPLVRETIDGAAFHMDTADYDFHLFIEAGSGQDSVIYRAGPTGYRVAQADPTHRGDLASLTVPFTMTEGAAPLLTTDEAVHRLNRSDQPFLFFVDGECGRGCVLYRRYDGNFGLLAPAAGQPPADPDPVE